VLASLAAAGAAAADTGPFDPGPFTDNRADMPSRPGTVVEVDYGPFTVGANSEVHNLFDSTAPPPCTNCRITDIVPELVYAPGSPDGSTAGSVANLKNGGMLHHFVLLNPGSKDLGCPSGSQGTFGERLFASGNERTHTHLPTPYGYENNSATWILIYHLVNKSSVAKSFNIKVTYRYRPKTETQPTRPVWLDIDGCVDSEYTIPASPTYSNYHDPTGSTTPPYSADWMTPFDSRVLAISGHTHDINVTNVTRCNNSTDDDADSLVNDGCPAVGAAESGSQCSNATDDDGDGKVNDGCPNSSGPAETGTQCSNAHDDEGDGRVNDGCPVVAGTAETGAQCENTSDDDGDSSVNDGCPGTSLPEGPCLIHCAQKGGGLAVSAEVVGGPGSDYFGPSPPNNPRPPDDATLCRSEGYFGSSYFGGSDSAWYGHLDTMSTCGIFTAVPGTAEPLAYPPTGAYPASGYPLKAGQTIRLHSEYQNNTGETHFDVMGIMVAWIAPVYTAPVGASPLRVSLVPSYQPCETGSANSTHGSPLSFPSCHSPVLTSSTVSMGPNSIGFARWVVCDVSSASSFCNPAGGVMPKPDLRFTASIRDVKCRTTAPPGCTAGGDYNPNDGTGPYTDTGNGTGGASPPCYPGAGSSTACIASTDVTQTASIPGGSVNGTGKFQGNGIRITDQNNQPFPSATMVNIAFPIPMDCLPTATADGSSCGVNTTASALAPGSVGAGYSAVWQIGQIQLKDSGPDGTRGNSDDQVFASQGIFEP
jgi:hypothetical protein